MSVAQGPSVHLASAALPAASGWSAQSGFPMGNADHVSFLVSYQGGAAGGQVEYRIVKGHYPGTLGAEQIASSVLTPDGSGNGASEPIYDAEYTRPVTGTAATTFAVDFDARGGWGYVALQVREVGVPGTPGTASITVASSY